MMRKLMIPLAAGALLAAGAVAPAQAAPQAVGEVQLVSANYLDTSHTVRHADGTWQPWGTMSELHYQYADQLASVMVNGVEHVFVNSEYAHMPPAFSYSHLIRDAGGNWTWGNVPDSGAIGDGQAVANLNGHIALVRRTGDVLKLSVQQDDNSWSAWETVPTSGAFGSFSVTANADVLRVVVSTTDGTKIGDYDRAANGTWSQPNWVPFNGGIATQVAVAQVGADLQVAAVAHNGDRSEVWHSVRHANGGWDQFGYVEGAAGDIPAVEQIAVTASHGTLQLVAATTDGGLYHTIRFANRTWQGFGDVKSAAGQIDTGDVTIAGE
jgi:hypothetical protein